MDFVGQHDDAVLQADLADAHQVFRRPAVPGGVLRVAQQEGMRVVADAALEVVEVHLELAVDELQRAFLGPGLRRGEVAVETVVGRRLQQDLRALGVEGVEHGDDRGVHTVGNHHRLGIDRHAVAALVPRHDRVGHLRRPLVHVEIAPVLVLDAGGDGTGDRRGRLEVDVGDAHADLDAALAVAADLLIELRRVGADAVVNGVEIERAVGGLLVGRSRGRRRGCDERRTGSGGGAGKCCQTCVPQKGAAIQSIRLRHG